MAKRNWTSSVPKRFYQLSSITLILSGNFGVATSAISEEVASAPPSARTFEQELVRLPSRKLLLRDTQVGVDSRCSDEYFRRIASRPRESGSTRVEDVVHMVPGLAYTENSVGQAVIAIRGIQTSALTGNVQQPVEIYYDDVPILDLTIPGPFRHSSCST